MSSTKFLVCALVCALMVAAPAGAVEHFFDDFNDNDMSDWTDTDKTVRPFNNTLFGLYGHASRGENAWVPPLDPNDPAPPEALEALATKPFANTNYGDTIYLSFDLIHTGGYKGDTTALGFKTTRVFMVNSATGEGYGLFFGYSKRGQWGQYAITRTTDYGATRSGVEPGAEITLGAGIIPLDDFGEHTLGLMYDRVGCTYNMYLDGSWVNTGGLDLVQNEACAYPDMIISSPRNLFNTDYPDWSGWMLTDDIWVGDGFNALPETILDPGDTNGDLKVDIQDLTALAANWSTISPGAKDWNQADCNWDWTVDIQDLTALAANWTFGPGSTESSVPEPATMALFALGGLALLRRRRS